MTANVNSMAWIGQVAERPWWLGSEADTGQATHVGDRGVTAKEMLKASGVDWTVQCSPLYAMLEVGKQHKKKSKTVAVPTPRHHALVREDTKAVLGIQTKRFEPVQNATSFEFFDKVIGLDSSYYETAGAIGAGEKVWIMARLPEEDTLIAGIDPIFCYLILVNAHDGSMAFRMMFTPIRPVCENTVNVALLRGESANNVYRQPHLVGVNKRLNADVARETLGLAKEYMTSFKEEADRMAETRMTEDEVTGFLQRVLPCPKHLLLAEPKANRPLALLKEPDPKTVAPNYGVAYVKQRVRVRDLIEHGAGQDPDDPIGSKINGSRWAAFQGVAEWADYIQGWDSSRTSNLLFGEGQTLKQRAWNILTQWPVKKGRK